MPLVYMKLTKTQANSLGKGKGARVTPSTSADIQNVYAVDMDASDYKRYSKAVLHGKGCIVKGSILESSSDDEEVEGGKVNWKKVGRQIKKGINTIGVDSIEGLKKNVPQEVAKQIVQNGVAAGVLGATTFVGMPNPQLAQAAGKYSSSGVDAAYKTDFRQKGALKKFGKNYLDDVKDDMINDAMSGGKIKINQKKIKRGLKKFANTVGSDLLESAKKNITKEQFQQAVQNNINKIVQDPDLADKLAGYSQDVIDAGYNTDYKQKGALKSMGRQLQGTKQNIIDDAINYGLEMNGGAVGRKAKFVKGSPEAKAYMQQLRNKRRSASGSGMVQQQVASIEKKMSGKGMVPLGKGMVPLGKGMVPL